MASQLEQPWRYSRAELLQLREQAASVLARFAAGIVVDPSTEVLFSGQGDSLAERVHHQNRRRGQLTGQASSKGETRTLAPQQHPRTPQWMQEGSRSEARQPGVLGQQKEKEADWGDEEEWDSEEENLQYKAFHVEGEPDFSIQDPDAEEYLKRVRWEARRCPRVVVAAPALPLPAPCAQTAYLPQLLTVAPCPPHLLPHPGWETSFLADFSDLRTELVQLFALVAQGAADAAAGPLLPAVGTALPPLRDAGAWKRFCLGHSLEGQQTQGDHHHGVASGDEQQAREPEEGREHEGGDAERENAGRLESEGRDAIRPHLGSSGDERAGSGHGDLRARGASDEGAWDGEEVRRDKAAAPSSPSEDSDFRPTEWIHVAGPAPGGTSKPPSQACARGSLQAGAGLEGSGHPEATPTAPAQRASSRGESPDEHGESESTTGAILESADTLGTGALGEVGESERGEQRRGRRRAEKRGPLLEGVVPFLGLLLKLDEVTIALHLRYHIRWLQDLPSSRPLDRPRAVWLFALCAAVSKPLDADTMAALRDLLRWCASRRASKVSAADPELALLNILIVISGRYFGQQER